MAYGRSEIVLKKRNTVNIRRESTYTTRETTAVSSRSSLNVKKINKNKVKKHKKQKKLALLLPGHNEELIIATTIKSAISAGQNKKDIFVVDDGSTDKTREIATKLLGKNNVITVTKSGKAMAVKKAIQKFKLKKGYKWIHIADADSVFSPDYFRIYKKALNDEYAVAVGFVQSLRGNWISTYRSLTYTYSQHITRRLQSYFGMISVFPGPITCFNTRIIDDLDFTVDSMTEDFDITLQVHRKNLGKIKYIPKAINYTQDPQTLGDFYKQNSRWQRGFFQGVKKYHIGINPHKIDISLGLQMSQALILFYLLLVIYPVIIFQAGNWQIIPYAIAIDYILNSIIAIWVTFATKRWYILGAMPYFYFLRWVEIYIYVKAFVEVMLLGRFKTSQKGWATEGRRYNINKAALKDLAVK